MAITGKQHRYTIDGCSLTDLVKSLDEIDQMHCPKPMRVVDIDFESETYGDYDSLRTTTITVTVEDGD